MYLPLKPLREPRMRFMISLVVGSSSSVKFLNRMKVIFSLFWENALYSSAVSKQVSVPYFRHSFSRFPVIRSMKSAVPRISIFFVV